MSGIIDLRSDWREFLQNGQLSGVLQQVQGGSNDLVLELCIIGFAQWITEAKWQTQASRRSYPLRHHLQEGQRNRGDLGLFNHACNQSDRLMTHRSGRDQKYRICPVMPEHLRHLWR